MMFLPCPRRLNPRQKLSGGLRKPLALSQRTNVRTAAAAEGATALMHRSRVLMLRPKRVSRAIRECRSHRRNNSR